MSIVNIITNMAIWLVTCPLSNASRKERAGKLLQELLEVPVGVQGEESRPCSILYIHIYIYIYVGEANHIMKSLLEKYNGTSLSLHPSYKWDITHDRPL